MSHLGEAKISISVHIDAGSPPELLDAVIEMMQKYRLDLGVPVDFADEDDGVGGADEDEPTETDPLMPEARELLEQFNRVSASMLVRRLRVGYTRAMRMMAALRAEYEIDENGNRINHRS